MTDGYRIHEAERLPEHRVESNMTQLVNSMVLALLLAAAMMFLAPVSVPSAGVAAGAEASTVAECESNMRAAESHYREEDFYVAEEMFAGALDGVNALDNLPGSTADAGLIRIRRRCYFALADIARHLGKREEARRWSIAYRQELLQQKSGFRRDQTLQENELRIIDDSIALGHFRDARTLLKNLLDGQSGELKPYPRLITLVRLATVEERAGDSETARRYWTDARDEGLQLMERLRQHPSIPDQVLCARQLALCFEALDAVVEAEAQLDWLFTVYAKQRNGGKQMRDTCLQLAEQLMLRRAPQRAELYLRVALSESTAADDRRWNAHIWNQLAQGFKSRNEFDKSLQCYGRAAEIFEQVIAEEAAGRNRRPLIAGDLKRLRDTFRQAQRWPDAIDAGKRLLEFQLDRHGEDHRAVIDAKAVLGNLQTQLGQYANARPLLESVVAYWRARPVPSPMDLATALNNLAAVLRGMSQQQDSRRLFEEAHALREKHLPPDHPDLARSLNNLGSVLVAEGQFTAAVQLYNRGLELCKGQGSRTHEFRSTTLLNLAVAYKSQGQYEEATRYCREALEIHREVFGERSLGAVPHYNALSSLFRAAHQYASAYYFANQALESCRIHHAEDSPAAAVAHDNLGAVCRLAYEYRQAEEHWRRSLEIHRQHGRRSMVARTLNSLGIMAFEQNDFDAAGQLFEEALLEQKAGWVRSQDRYSILCNLASVRRQEGHKKEARELLAQAIELAEAPRSATVGAELERAEYFAQFASAFEILVDWSCEEGDFDNAFLTAERARNRTFLDQLKLAGVDLRATLPPADNALLLQSESDLSRRLNSIRAQGLAAQQQSEPDGQVEQLSNDLQQAQKEYARLWTTIRHSSPLYRSLLTQEEQTWPLTKVRATVMRDSDLLLFYCLGSQHSHLLVIGDSPGDVAYFPLNISESLAEMLQPASPPSTSPNSLDERGVVGIETTEKVNRIDAAGRRVIRPGPLTRGTAAVLVNWYLSDLRSRSSDLNRGIVARTETLKVRQLGQSMTALTEILLPGGVRELIRKRNPGSLIIIPDGALHSLPFEALLLRERPVPQFVLDEFPPISYAPSANILANLTMRPPVASTVRSTLLTVGDPAYPQPIDESVQEHVVDLLRDGASGFLRQLPLLPGTATECRQVADAFGMRGARTTLLLGHEATEANFQNAVAQAGILHLAAHGIIDEHHENLFGAIALTPPAPGSGANYDGLLTYNEILQLPLRQCELAVLSACRTNVGSDRPMEAGTSLAQAFLAAGARRVIASHWNVSDRSTEVLMSTFFKSIAVDLSQGSPVDYATALREARRAVRRRPEWSAPHHWAGFVLLGPAQDRTADDDSSARKP